MNKLKVRYQGKVVEVIVCLQPPQVAEVEARYQGGIVDLDLALSSEYQGPFSVHDRIWLANIAKKLADKSFTSPEINLSNYLNEPVTIVE